jgi:hypothetical protein
MEDCGLGKNNDERRTTMRGDGGSHESFITSGIRNKHVNMWLSGGRLSTWYKCVMAGPGPEFEPSDSHLSVVVIF